LVPSDFASDALRSVRLTDGSASVSDLYRVIAFGMQGPMPGYGHLGSDKVWQVAYYVKSLVDQSRSASARDLVGN
jgi:hypothetical protein